MPSWPERWYNHSLSRETDSERWRTQDWGVCGRKWRPLDSKGDTSTDGKMWRTSNTFMYFHSHQPIKIKDIRIKGRENKEREAVLVTVMWNICLDWTDWIRLCVSQLLWTADQWQTDVQWHEKQTNIIQTCKASLFMYDLQYLFARMIITYPHTLWNCSRWNVYIKGKFPYTGIRMSWFGVKISDHLLNDLQLDQMIYNIWQLQLKGWKYWIELRYLFIWAFKLFN